MSMRNLIGFLVRLVAIKLGETFLVASGETVKSLIFDKRSKVYKLPRKFLDKC